MTRCRGVDLASRLASGPPVLLDGPMGTRLQHRGVDTSLPLWSARAVRDAPEAVMAVHREWLRLGAEVHTADTFRTNPRTLAGAGVLDDPEAPEGSWWAREAVRLCREAVREADHPVWVAGSLAPVEDCYTPAAVPDDEVLAREHAVHAAVMDVDLFLVETMCTVREAVAATRAAVATGKPVWTSFVVGLDGRLLSGEAVVDAVAAVADLGPQAVLLNCGSITAIDAALPDLCAAWDGPWGAYANVGSSDPMQGWAAGTDATPADFGAAARRWRDAGARILGTCCGSTPAHYVAVREAACGSS